MENASANKEWSFCPVCGQKLCKVTPKYKGGVYDWCKNHKGEVEVPPIGTNDKRLRKHYE